MFSINARGIRDLFKRKAIYLYCRGKGADFHFVQETHACPADESFWKNQWGNEMWFSNGNNRSAGVAILKDKFKGQILHSETDMSGRWIILVVDMNQSQFILINNYATNNKTTNLALFQSIESKIYHLYSTYPLAKVIWGGDFNTVFDEIMD